MITLWLISIVMPCWTFTNSWHVSWQTFSRWPNNSLWEPPYNCSRGVASLDQVSPTHAHLLLCELCRFAAALHPLPPLSSSSRPSTCCRTCRARAACSKCRRLCRTLARSRATWSTRARRCSGTWWVTALWLDRAVGWRSPTKLCLCVCIKVLYIYI